MANKPKTPQLVWQHAWLVPYFTALLYFVSYIYQSTYNSYFGVPSYLIDIDSSKIILTLLPMAFFIMALFLLMDIIGLLFRLDVRKRQDKQTVGLLILLLTFYFGLILLIPINIHKIVDLTVFFGITAVALTLFVLIGTKKIAKNLTNREQMSRIEIKGYMGMTDYLLKQASTYGVIIVGTVVICMFGFSLGELFPSYQNTYLALKTDPEYIVVNTYRGEFVMAQLSGHNSNQLNGNYKVINISNAQLVRRHITVEALTHFAR